MSFYSETSFSNPSGLVWTALKSSHVVFFRCFGNFHVGTIVYFHCSLFHFLYKLLMKFLIDSRIWKANSSQKLGAVRILVVIFEVCVIV